MQYCEVKSSVDAETLALYGVEPNVTYSADDENHKKNGILMVYLYIEGRTKIEIPINLVAFLPTYHNVKNSVF
jgi:hypothetical protein